MEEKKTLVKLTEYKGVPVKKRSAEVTEEEIAAEMERARTYAATTQDKTDGEAEMDDQVVIDFVGYIDDVPFEGGEGADYPLVLGSHTFIPGFEEQLVGAKVGDRLDVKVPFPENYHDKRYAGRDAVFKVTVKGLRTSVVPEMSDEVVSRISSCKSVDEFREYVRGEIKRYKEDQNRQERENEILTKIVEESEIAVPQALVDERAAILKNNLIGQLTNSGTTLETYLDYNNITEETLDRYNTVNALNMLRSQAVLGRIAEAEGISCTDDEIEQELYIMARNYQTTIEDLRGLIGEEGVRMVGEDILDKKALDFVMKHATEAEEEA